MDLVSPEEAARLEALLRALNPGADIVRTTNSEVPLLRVIATGRFSFDKAAKVPGWLKVRSLAGWGAGVPTNRAC